MAHSDQYYWSKKNRVSKTGSDVIVPSRFGEQFSDLKLSVTQMCFLYCFIQTCGHLTRAAQAARINRVTHYSWLNHAENKEDYRIAWERVQPIAAQMVLDQAVERAAHGVEEPVFYKGEVVGFVKKYSDNVLITLLKGLIPDKFKDRVEQTVGNKPGEAFKLDPGREALPDDKLNALIELAKKLTEKAPDA